MLEWYKKHSNISWEHFLSPTFRKTGNGSNSLRDPLPAQIAPSGAVGKIFVSQRGAGWVDEGSTVATIPKRVMVKSLIYNYPLTIIILTIY